MIIYQSGNWLALIRQFHQSDTIKDLGGKLVIVALYVTAFAIIDLHFLKERPPVNPSYLSTMGILLSLLVAFRTNKAYDRFWEGRTLWGSLISACRNCAIIAHSVLPRDDERNRLFFARMLTNYAGALRDHLRGGVDLRQLEPMEAEVHKTVARQRHKPTAIASELQVRFEELRRAGVFADIHLLAWQAEHDRLLQINGGCERIYRTPIPFSYSFFIKLFISAYIMFMPVALLDSWGYFTIPAVLFAAYVLIGIELISEEIEEPFGWDINDISTGQLAHSIRVSVHELMGITLPDVEAQPINPDFTVIH
jgi:ion channel-forming bestrophin family protein